MLFRSAAHKAALIESRNPHHKSVRHLDLLNDREPSEALGKWKSAGALLQRVGAQLVALPQPAEIVNAYVLAIDPGGFEQWHEDDMVDPGGFMRLHALLHPAPALRLYSGSEVFAPQPWQVLSASDVARR